MGFNQLWGVGKDNRSTISPITTDTGTAVKNYVVGTTTEATALATQRLLFIYISLSMKQDIAGTATGQFFNVLIDSKTIVSYAPSGSNQVDWQVSEVIPVDIEAVNSRIILEFGCSGEGGDYGVVSRIRTYGLAID